MNIEDPLLSFICNKLIDILFKNWCRLYGHFVVDSHIFDICFLPRCAHSTLSLCTHDGSKKGYFLQDVLGISKKGVLFTKCPRFSRTKLSEIVKIRGVFSAWLSEKFWKGCISRLVVWEIGVWHEKCPQIHKNRGVLGINFPRLPTKRGVKFVKISQIPRKIGVILNFWNGHVLRLQIQSVHGDFTPAI